MPSLRRKLPPLTALTAFEAAARLASFTKAALELGITQAAVSRQIHALEEILGSPLFRRLHRRVELTESGRLLCEFDVPMAGHIYDNDVRWGGNSVALPGDNGFQGCPLS